jgi:hypothetical protein
MARQDEEIDALKQRVSKLEHQVNLLLNNLPFNDPGEPDPGITPEVIDLVRMGRKVEAIRLYRELTGVGLKAAKQVIDALPNRGAS